MMMDILAENELTIEDRSQVLTGWGKCWTYTIYAIYSTLPVGLLAVIFWICAIVPSLLGLVAMFATLLVLKLHSSSFWKDSYKIIGMVCQVFVLFTYTLDSVILLLSQNVQPADVD